MRIHIVLFLGVLVSGCGGSNATSSSPIAPTPTGPQTPPSPTTSGPLPLGTASANDTACPAGSTPAAQCKRMTVTCPSIPTIGATLRITPPAATRGTVLLSTGGAGSTLNGSNGVLARQMTQTMAADGMTVVEIAWDQPGIWSGPRARTYACRYATGARWVYDNLHPGGSAALFAAQGTSGGSSQIAFGLAHYGLGDIVGLANLGSGPPGCPQCSPDGANGPEPLLPGDPPSVNRTPVLSYPRTTVRFFLGDGEPTPQIVTDANAYFAAITSARTMTTVPGTGHDIEATAAGVDAYVQSVRSGR